MKTVKRSKVSAVWIGWVILGLLLGACVPAATPTPAVVEKPVEVTRIIEVTPTPPATPTPRFAGVTLTLLDNPEGQTENMIALQKRCEEKTGIRLNVEVVPHGEVRPKLLAALANKLPTYDLFYVDIIDLPQYAAAGYTYPLEGFLTPEMRADILPFAEKGVIYEGKWIALPWKAEWMSFVYNKKMLKDAGYDRPPRTWDELIQMSLDLKKKGIVKYPMVFSWAANYEQVTVDYVMLVKSLGGELFDAQGNPVFNQGAGVQALQLMYDMMHKYEIIDPAALTLRGGGKRRDVMLAGQGAFVFLWGTPLLVMNDPAKSPRAGEFDIALAPAGPGGPYSVAGPMGWAISAYSKNPEAAWEFLRCIAGPEGEKFMFLKEGAPPGWKSVLNDPEVSMKLKQAGGDVMLQQAAFLAMRPALPYYQEWSAAIQKAIQEVLTKQKTPQKALEEVAAYTRELKAKYGR
ncbi:extracellular solute-binding protein [Thermoflexus sp.]|uniref:extracellular solute-binding protein n=1 Tax=Thermoflexus sp. TaxID=1969742 RepID=UPI0025E6D344|nr:extracellular solute-binding protein [Thermoflexus sp.]MCS7350507.1 extracellular solute-binding protein [Thermoflexus sp.]MCX7690320.1 extracellular solute-binding protein [Thermoflexus sp.]MDW8179958.1 extracellular solute-binding protein [Anaerolineae bacterium]